jgi:hypothetical protein
MAFQGFASPAVENLAAKNKSISFRVTIVGSTTEASITASTDANDGIRVWLSSQSATAPSNANFASLISSATPTVIGLYLTDGRAAKLKGVVVEVNSIRSASMTAGVVTNKGATSAIAGNTGVTSDGNLAFQIACTTLKATDAANTHQFDVTCSYDVL